MHVCDVWLVGVVFLSTAMAERLMQAMPVHLSLIPRLLYALHTTTGEPGAFTHMIQLHMGRLDRQLHFFIFCW